MTYNIRGWRTMDDQPNLDAVGAVIASTQADIVGLNEVFHPHVHWGGEEILVIEGRFIDENGEYPAGSWIRSPHLSEHLPRVEEKTLILVKVGHLPPSVQSDYG